jgi:hypothetical protein
VSTILASGDGHGIVGFAIGSETLGTIVSPSVRYGITGLGPTLSRAGLALERIFGVAAERPPGF